MIHRIMTLAAGLFGLILLLGVMAFCSVPSHAQDDSHIHGENNLPDWYDPSCCNQRDCKPVKDEEIEFDTIGGAPVARHVPTGSIFTQDRWKISQDERYHVCIWNSNPLCVYIRPGV
jgi:hypothetical protein